MKAIGYESAQHDASPLSSMGSGRRGSGRGIRYENWAPRSRSGRVGSGLKRVQEIQCRFRENTPLGPTPLADLRGQPRGRNKIRDDPMSRFESRRVTLECQTLKVREKVRRSFVTDLAKFRHLFIRQSVGFVTESTGSKSPYYIAHYFEFCAAQALVAGSRPV